MVVIVTIVVVIVLITSIILMLTFLPVKQVNIESSRSVEYQQDVTFLDLNVSANIMKLGISCQEMEDKLVQFDLKVTGNTSLLSSTDVLEEYVFDQSIEGDSLFLSILVKIKEGSWGISNLKVAWELIIHPSLTSSISAESKVGVIDLVSTGEVTFESIFIKVDLG